MKTHSTSPSVTGPRLLGIERARDMALLNHGPLPVGWLAPWIERSWQRCLAQGRDPDEDLTFEALSEAQMRRTHEANHLLIQTARPVLEKLGRAIMNTRYFAILTNAAGVVMDASGQIDRSDPRAHLITRVGVDLSERCIGTTAIGSALSELQPVWLHRGEHFFTHTAHYSCAGAPLFGPDGACVGMLDLTGIDALERPELKHLVAQCAGKIENALLLSLPHRLMIRLNWPGTPLGSDADGMVGLDGDGCVTGANAIARQMVPNLAGPGQPGVHVSDLFGVSPQSLFDAARRPDLPLEIPLWTGLTLQALPMERRYEERPVASAVRPQVDRQRPLKDIEHALILKAVEQARGNVTQAARALGIGRATVYRKLGQRAKSTSTSPD